MSYQTVVACVLTLLTTVADKHHIGHRGVAIEYHDIGARYMLLEIHGYLALYSVTVSDKKRSRRILRNYTTAKQNVKQNGDISPERKLQSTTATRYKCVFTTFADMYHLK